MSTSEDLQSTREHLTQLAHTFVTACPDMRQMAREQAQAILQQYGHADLDPDHVYLNRFNTAQSSPRTFSGWQHSDSPYQSFTLPQLVMHRFDVQDQDNEDLLGYLSGFYSDGADKDAFDERNEIAIAPKDVLEDFWKIDFSEQFHLHMQEFWQTHDEDFRTLAKVNFLSKVVEACIADSESELAKRGRLAAKALTGFELGPLDLQQLGQKNPPQAGYRLCTFDIGGYIATDFLRIEMDDGYQLLYTPGETDALHLFDSRKAMYWWVLMNTNEAANRTRFMSHFALQDHGVKGDNIGLHDMIDVLFYHWGGDDHQCLNQLDQTVSTDAFDHLRDAARQRMADDGRFALRSNTDLRKQLWIGYLKAFARIAGPLAALDWPVALAAVGAGIADMGLNIDQAVNGATTQQREAGTVGAITAAIDVLFNATLLIGAGGGELEAPGELPEPVEGALPSSPERERPPEPVMASPAEIEAWVPEPFKPSETQQLLAPFETNVLLSAPTGTGKLEGIHLEDGNFYALIDDMPYQVRYVGEMKTWVVVDPQNPYSYYQNVPIRLGADGQWQPIPRLGQGGAVPSKLLSLWGRVTHPTTTNTLPRTPYEIPETLQPTLEDAVTSQRDGLLSGRDAYGDPDRDMPFEAFRDIRDKLAADAQGYLASVELPQRPELPALPPQANAKQIIQGIYKHSKGLVIGEDHAGMSSKQFLIDNMAILKKEKVKVLYMEHYMTDFHQADLDTFNATGVMPPRLRNYIISQDIGHRPWGDGRYTFEQVFMAAQKNGIRIQAIDCMASYKQAWLYKAPAGARQQMMNFYAHTVIQADQTLRGSRRWIALVGDSHANTFEGVPGVAELEGAVGLHIEDIDINSAGSIEADPGASIKDERLVEHFVKGDFRLKVPIKGLKTAETSLEVRLKNKGAFTFDNSDNGWRLVHRSNDGRLKFTPIRNEGNRLYIDKPDWPWASGRRLRNRDELRTLLEHRGLTYVQP